MYNEIFNKSEYELIMQESGLNRFVMSVKQWHEKNGDKKGNIRDYANINELICLSNMENINTVLIEEGVPQDERILKLNSIAIHQMTVLEIQKDLNYLK